MPLIIDTPDQDVVVAQNEGQLTIPVRTEMTSAADVVLLRVLPDEALEGWLTCQDSYPIRVKRGQQHNLTLAVRSGLRESVRGTLDLHIAEGPFCAVLTVRLNLWPTRPFKGVFAVDFGSSRISAAYIDPEGLTDVPRMVELPGGRRWLDSSFIADFAHDPPRGRDLEEIPVATDYPLLANLFLRPRQHLIHNYSRTIVDPSTGTRQVDAARSAAWALARFLREADKCPLPGQPSQVYVPLSASLTPSQAARFEELIAETPGLHGRVNPQRCRLGLDEATAAAFAWVRETYEELVGLTATGEETRFRLLVLDAGASSVDLSLLELTLVPQPGPRLCVTPRQLTRDGFAWMAGDRVTAHIFRLLRLQIATQLRPDLGLEKALLRDPDTDHRAESVFPTRFVNQMGRTLVMRFRNFFALWNAAEQLKTQLRDQSTPLPCRLEGLFLPGKEETTSLEVRLDPQELEVLLLPDLDCCRLRLEHLLVRDETEQCWPVDRMLVTGEAARLNVLRRELIETTARRHQFSWIDWTDRGKEVVAKGAALAAYYHDHVADTVSRNGMSRLVFRMEEFGRHLPFSLLCSGSVIPFRLFPTGMRFEEVDGQLQPLKFELKYLPSLSFFRCAGGGPLPRIDAEAKELTQPLGHVDLAALNLGPGNRDVKVLLFPDHQIQVQAGNAPPLEVALEEPAVDPISSPFGGQL